MDLLLRLFATIFIPPVLEATVAELSLRRAIHVVAEHAAALSVVPARAGQLGLEFRGERVARRRIAASSGRR